MKLTDPDRDDLGTASKPFDSNADGVVKSANRNKDETGAPTRALTLYQPETSTPHSRDVLCTAVGPCYAACEANNCIK